MGASAASSDDVDSLSLSKKVGQRAGESAIVGHMYFIFMYHVVLRHVRQKLVLYG
jgi:hypothetical protein